MPKDYAHSEDFDLVIEKGDFKVIESTLQHQHNLILTHAGELRLFPYLGVGISDWANDDQPGDLHRKIREQFQFDGMKVAKLVIYENGEMEVRAGYRE